VVGVRNRGPGDRGKETAASSAAAQAAPAAHAAATAAEGLSRSFWRKIMLVVLLEKEEDMAGERRESRPSKT